MRQIKFREWLGKEFHYWGFLRDGAFIGPSDPKGIHNQFTGLLDNNGNEIYSDDVLLYADGLLYQVVWHNRLASFGLKHPDGVRFIKFYGEGYNTEDMTIKGNIYENPDLLK